MFKSLNLIKCNFCRFKKVTKEITPLNHSGTPPPDKTRIFPYCMSCKQGAGIICLAIHPDSSSSECHGLRHGGLSSNCYLGGRLLLPWRFAGDGWTGQRIVAHKEKYLCADALIRGARLFGSAADTGKPSVPL